MLQSRRFSPSMHADIQTPTWRPFVPSAHPPSHEGSISSDDTSDTHYRRLHTPPLQAERARWGPPTASPSTYTPKKTRRPAPLFPTPAESAAITRRAVRNLKRLRRPRRQHSVLSARRAALTKFDRTLAAFAEIEGSLERHRLSLQNHAPNLYAQGSVKQGATLRLPFPPAHHPAAARVGHGFANGPHGEEEVPAHIAVASVADGALADLDDLELIMREKSKAFADRVAAMAEQAHIRMRVPITCESLRGDIASAKKREEVGRRSRVEVERAAVGLSECIKKEIDDKVYPLLADSFWLHPNYRLDGTRRPLEEVLQLEREQDEDEDEDGEEDEDEQKGRKYGFALGAGNGHVVDDDALQIDVAGSGAEDRVQAHVESAGSMRDLADEAADLDSLWERSSPRTPRNTRANGAGSPQNRVSGRQGRGRPRRGLVKKEKRITRATVRTAEIISSDGSVAPDGHAETYGGRRETARRTRSSRRFHQVVDCDREQDGVGNGPTAVVELDTDDDSDFGL